MRETNWVRRERPSDRPVDAESTALSSRDAEIKEVLEGLATHQIGSRRPCWCPPDYESKPHSAACLAAHALWEKVRE